MARLDELVKCIGQLHANAALSELRTQPQSHLL